ncbi:hypothetical protein G5I_10034 [Acromyrmex echinatior]|uniref:Uncharacterized protein n=1 Tax=Acromyrmex echinatior TaxID=103372 RepID=F4WVT2_ACREC|nr:hypothetical protein G5I_10034 [Acromyrmex echinatior]
MQAILDQNRKTSQRKVCALISSVCIDIRPKLLRLTDFATVNLEETNGEATRKHDFPTICFPSGREAIKSFKGMVVCFMIPRQIPLQAFANIDRRDAVCATERAATIVQGPAQEAVESLDGHRYAFVNGYETNYIVGDTGNRGAKNIFICSEHRREKRMSDPPTPRRCDVFAIFSCKSAPHRTRICTCQRADDCGCCLPPNTHIREDFAVQARNARIETIRGLERDWAADVPCCYNHRRSDPDNVDVVVTVVVVDSGDGGDGEEFAVFAFVFRKHIPIMPFCYTAAQRQTHFRTRVDAPKHPEPKYEPTAKFMVANS